VKIGITGGAGFIGGHAAEVAIERGHEVTIFDHAGRSHTGAMWNPGDPMHTFLGDVRDEVDMREMAAHVDGIIHLAACLGTQETIKYPVPAAQTNVLGGLNFLEAVAQYGIAGAYIGVGNHWMQNTYSITKTAVERFVQMYNNERGTSVNIVRAMNAYGPRQSVAPPFGPAKVRKITPSFVCRALTGNPIELYGGGVQVSDMVHVRDVAQALVRALEASANNYPFGIPVEVGPARSLNVLAIANLVRRIANEEHGAPFVEHKDLPMRPGEIAGAEVSADVETLGFVDMDADDLVPIEQGMRETVNWYAENWLPKYLKGNP
jgi:nucleoside-diphosphate-sugar epimerase